MKTKLLLASLALALAFTSSVVAEEAYDRVQPVRVLKQALNLGDEQVTALRELIEDRHADVRASNEEIRELQAQLEELLKSEAPDQAEAGGLVLDIRELKQEIGQGHQAYQQSFRDLLTPEQVERLGHIHRIAMADNAADVLNKLNLH